MNHHLLQQNSVIEYLYAKKMKDLVANEAEWRLTPEEIRSEKGFEDASDEDVELIQSTLSLLALAYYENYINGFGIEMTTSKEG